MSNDYLLYAIMEPFFECILFVWFERKVPIVCVNSSLLRSWCTRWARRVLLGKKRQVTHFRNQSRKVDVLANVLYIFVRFLFLYVLTTKLETVVLYRVTIVIKILFFSCHLKGEKWFYQSFFQTLGNPDFYHFFQWLRWLTPPFLKNSVECNFLLISFLASRRLIFSLICCALYAK